MNYNYTSFTAVRFKSDVDIMWSSKYFFKLVINIDVINETLSPPRQKP